MKKFIQYFKRLFCKANVSGSLPSDEVRELLLEAQYRLGQAVDIFNGSSGLATGGEDKYSKMNDCIDNIQEFLERGNDR